MSAVVILALVFATSIPVIPIVVAPGCKDTIFELILLVIVPTGVAENATTKIPLKVPEITPPTELVTVFVLML